MSVRNAGLPHADTLPLDRGARRARLLFDLANAIGAGEERQLDAQDHLAGCFRDHPLFLSCLLTVARGILPSAETAEGR